MSWSLTERHTVLNETLYVSGGMTNLPEFNFPLFDAVSDALRRMGATIYSPAENDRGVLAEHGIHDVTQVDGYAEGDVARYDKAIGDTKDLFRWDFTVIIQHCTGIVMLPRWERSTGARWERIVAEALGLKVFLATDNYAGVPSKWYIEPDPIQQRVSNYLRGFARLPEARGAVLQAVGHASVCWSPSGVFDEAEATKVADDLLWKLGLADGEATAHA